MEGEGHDRTILGLPQSQIDLATNVTAAQPHTIVVLVNGGEWPHAFGAIVQKPSELPTD